MNMYYITFGYGHTHVIEGEIFNWDCVGTIEASDYNTAREFVFGIFGPKFAFIYSTLQDVDLELYPRGLVEIPLGSITMKVNVESERGN